MEQNFWLKQLNTMDYDHALVYLHGMPEGQSNPVEIRKDNEHSTLFKELDKIVIEHRQTVIAYSPNANFPNDRDKAIPVIGTLRFVINPEDIVMIAFSKADKRQPAVKDLEPAAGTILNMHGGPIITDDDPGDNQPEKEV